MLVNKKQLKFLNNFKFLSTHSSNIRFLCIVWKYFERKIKKKISTIRNANIVWKFQRQILFRVESVFGKLPVTSPLFKFKQVRFNSFPFLGGNVNQLKKLVIVNAGKDYFEFKLERHTISEKTHYYLSPLILSAFSNILTPLLC